MCPKSILNFRSCKQLVGFSRLVQNCSFSRPCRPLRQRGNWIQSSWKESHQRTTADQFHGSPLGGLQLFGPFMCQTGLVCHTAHAYSMRDVTSDYSTVILALLMTLRHVWAVEGIWDSRASKLIIATYRFSQWRWIQKTIPVCSLSKFQQYTLHVGVFEWCTPFRILSYKYAKTKYR